jgi:hypothetical protein
MFSGVSITTETRTTVVTETTTTLSPILTQPITAKFITPRPYSTRTITPIFRTTRGITQPKFIVTRLRYVIPQSTSKSTTLILPTVTEKSENISVAAITVISFGKFKYL